MLISWIAEGIKITSLISQFSLILRKVSLVSYFLFSLTPCTHSKPAVTLTPCTPSKPAVNVANCDICAACQMLGCCPEILSSGNSLRAEAAALLRLVEGGLQGELLAAVGTERLEGAEWIQEHMAWKWRWYWEMVMELTVMPFIGSHRILSFLVPPLPTLFGGEHSGGKWGLVALKGAISAAFLFAASCTDQFLQGKSSWEFRTASGKNRSPHCNHPKNSECWKSLKRSVCKFAGVTLLSIKDPYGV